VKRLVFDALINSLIQFASWAVNYNLLAVLTIVLFKTHPFIVFASYWNKNDNQFYIKITSIPPSGNKWNQSFIDFELGQKSVRIPALVSATKTVKPFQKAAFILDCCDGHP
jgi:hypothetical protein